MSNTSPFVLPMSPANFAQNLEWNTFRFVSQIAWDDGTNLTVGTFGGWGVPGYDFGDPCTWAFTGIHLSSIVGTYPTSPRFGINLRFRLRHDEDVYSDLFRVTLQPEGTLSIVFPQPILWSLQALTPGQDADVVVSPTVFGSGSLEGLDGDIHIQLFNALYRYTSIDEPPSFPL